MIILIEITAFLITIALSVCWIMIPDRNWEPWTIISGAITFSTELYRRFAPSKAVNLGDASWLKENIHSAKLSVSMPRALQYAKTTGKIELERWIRLELYGYNQEGGMTDSEEVPEYRSITGQWMDEFDRKLDVRNRPELSFINVQRLRFGVGLLEELASKTEMQNIAPLNTISVLREHAGVEVIRFCFNPIEVRGVLDIIKYRMIEMVSNNLLN